MHLFSTHFPRLPFFWQLASVYLLGAVLFSSATHAQNNNERNRTSYGSEYTNNYYVDEAGLQLAVNATPLDNFLDPNTYELGPYDVISLQGIGLTEFSYRAVLVNALGDIVTPIAGKINLKGLTLTEAETKVKEHFSTYVLDTEVFLTLDRPRPVNIHVGGNIPNPGRYVVPAGTRYDALISGFEIGEEIVSPLVNVENKQQIISTRQTISGINFDRLSATQSEEGEIADSRFRQLAQKYDMRYIKVSSKDGSVHYVDLHAYFNSGQEKFAPYITDGDQVTFIDHSFDRPTISISGAVNTPFTGSYRSDDTFEKLLLIAGGYHPQADSSQLIRVYEQNGERIREELSLSSTNLTEKLESGDQLIIPYKKTNRNKGNVQIEGMVAIPGIYTIENGETKLSEVVQIAGGLENNALASAAYLIRESANQRGVSSVTDINMTLLSKSYDQFLEGFDYLELEEILSANRMAIDLTNSQTLSEVTLQDGDRIYVPKDDRSIRIMGQVNNPGFYAYQAEQSVNGYLQRANGMTIAADRERIFVIKAGSRSWYEPQETSIESGDIIFVDRIPFQDAKTGLEYQVSIQELKNRRTQLIMTGISALTSVVTAYVAVRRLN
ncbi:MAG: SLBB domain-containing protein [Bacteroidetes bacterium]|nr:SLBB domain-containing protein [Balneolaceae bacterium]MDA0736231.1 SLBB domain-containing protein [Bacteroidota bacterium]MDA1127068.1 SLBB domain-containing protein [Bacteroidota bacterium]